MSGPAVPVRSTCSSTIALYRNDPNAGSRDIAQEAYNDAVEYLRRELKRDDKALRLLESSTSMSDFQGEVERARLAYQSRHPRGRCARLLEKLSSRILYYSKVLDVMAQHHPEYVALAWGSVKFVLIGIVNHEKLLAHFSTAMVEIGGALREANLSASLYQTEQMKQAISQLYAHIILFFQQAVKWYTKNRIGRALSVIHNPVELEYQETVEQIRFCAEAVNDLASAASRVEIRDIHVLLQLHQGKLHEMQEDMNHMHKSLEEKARMNLQVATSTKSLTTRISTCVADIHPRVHDLQFASILASLSPRHPPASTLSKIHSIANRASLRSVWFRDSPSTSELLSSLHTWVSIPSCSLFAVKVQRRAGAKAREFAANVISFLREKKFAVFFAISQPAASQEDDSQPTLTSLFKSLLFQALECFPSALTSDPSQLNVTKFATEHSEEEWRSLLFGVFAKITHCFVIIEAQDLLQAHRENPEWTAKFMLLWQELIDQAEREQRLIKILTLTYGDGEGFAMDSRGAEFEEDMQASSVGERGKEKGEMVKKRITSIIHAPIPIPPRLRRGRGPRARGNRLKEFEGLRPGF